MYYGLNYWRHSSIARAQRAALQEFGLRVVTDVVEADEPIQLADAYEHLRIYHDSNGSVDDTWLTAMIPAAREFCEGELGRSLATKTLELSTNRFPTVTVHTHVGPSIALPFGPVQSVSSVTYQAIQLDSNGDQVLDSNDDPVIETKTVDASTYELDTYVTPNRLVLAYGKAWPTDAISAVNSVKIRYVAGYVSAPDSNDHPVLPKMALAAIKVMLGHFYENREATGANTLSELPIRVQDMLDKVLNRERLGL